MPTETQLNQFCDIYFQHTGIKLTKAEAKAESYHLLQLMKAVYQPIPVKSELIKNEAEN